MRFCVRLLIGRAIVLFPLAKRRAEGNSHGPYEVSPDSSQLLLTLRIDNSRFGKPVKIRYVYDRVETDVVTP